MKKFLTFYTGGVLLALIEGIGIAMTRWQADQFTQGKELFVTLLPIAVCISKLHATEYLQD